MKRPYIDVWFGPVSYKWKISLHESSDDDDVEKPMTKEGKFEQGMYRLDLYCAKSLREAVGFLKARFKIREMKNERTGTARYFEVVK